MYRFAFAETLLYLACNVGLAVIFYRLFARVNNGVALLVAFFTLLGTAVESVTLFSHFAPLVFLGAGPALSAFTTEQLQALAYTSLRFFDVGFSVSLVFFGCYDIAAGFLIYRLTFLPRIIGVFMTVGGLCYVSNSLVYFMAPALQASLFPYILLPSLLGEASFCLWLLVRGVDSRRFSRLPSAAASLYEPTVTTQNTP